MIHDHLAAGHLAVELTRRTAGSALPDAPVVPDRPRPARASGTRTRVAGGLRALARWVEPCARPSGVPS